MLVSLLITAVILNISHQGDWTVKNLILGLFRDWHALSYYPIIAIITSLAFVLLVNHTLAVDQEEDQMGRDFSKSSRGDPYGDAHFEQPHEYVDYAQVRELKNCKGLVLGQLGKDGSECVDFNPYTGRLNKHMLAIGTSGGGKTFTFVKPFVYQSIKQRHSLVVTDPDGGLYEDLAGHLRDNGYIVRHLNLKDLEKSDGWHMLGSIGRENLSTNHKIFAQTIVTNMSSDSGSIYASASNSLLCALVLRVILGHDYPEEKKNIRSVYEMLQNPAGYSYLEGMFDKNALTEEEMPCLKPYMAFKQASENLAANIATHLANGLQLFQDELLCDVLSRDEIDLTLPGKVPCAYFCQFPDSHDTFSFIISLFFSMFFISLMDYADLHTKARKLDVPVDFLLDEFPSIGIIPEWSTKISVLRKRSINCIMIVQDMTQLQQKYENTWRTIVNNCGTIIALGINEMETAQWISNRIGEISIEVSSTSESRVLGRNHKDLIGRDSVGVGKRSLMSPAEVMKVNADNSIILFTGHNPILACKTPHILFPNSEMLYVTKPDEVINFSDHDAKAFLSHCEDVYRDAFWQSHDMHPDMRLSDLSDAKYTEAILTPLQAAKAVIIEDCTALMKPFRRKRTQQGAQSKEKHSKISNPISTQLAPKEAFKRFYELCVNTPEKAPEELIGEYMEQTFGCKITNTTATTVSSVPAVAPVAQKSTSTPVATTQITPSQNSSQKKVIRINTLKPANKMDINSIDLDSEDIDYIDDIYDIYNDTKTNVAIENAQPNVTEHPREDSSSHTSQTSNRVNKTMQEFFDRQSEVKTQHNAPEAESPTQSRDTLPTSHTTISKPTHNYKASPVAQYNDNIHCDSPLTPDETQSDKTNLEQSFTDLASQNDIMWNPTGPRKIYRT